MIFQHCSSQEGKLLDMLGEKEVDLIIGWLVNKKKMAHSYPEKK